VYGPDPTPSVAGYLEIALLSYFDQMCFGRMYTSMTGSFGSATEDFRTTVCGSGAVAVMFATVWE
jgi:hypothetical protein